MDEVFGKDTFMDAAEPGGHRFEGKISYCSMSKLLGEEATVTAGQDASTARREA
jgi:hypothetical protein